MKKSNHTPGPWKNIEDDDYVSLTKIVDADDVKVISEPFGLNSQREQANANLIAAAPEMLEALESALQLIPYLVMKFPDADERSDGTWASYRDEFSSAIAKARGEK